MHISEVQVRIGFNATINAYTFCL